MATTNMEPSPASFTPERYWTEEKERALIAFFSKHSCLWNHKSESYKNRQLRWRTLEHLRILLSADPPPVWFTVEDIKSKFKNLRTTFQRQYKLVKASRMCKSGDVFVPQWKHYQQLMFLQGCWDQDDSLDDAPLSPLITLQEENQTVPSTQEPVFSFLPIPATTSSSSSSAVPSNMIIKSFWTEERERELIIFYSEHSCLWNKGSENHNNRQLRLKLLEVLRSQLSQHPVSFSVEDLKCKFKNLRTVFNREYKAVEASRASDKPYVSKWKHYQQMLFLCESCDEDEGHDDVTLLRQEEKDPEPGNQTTNCSLSCFSSCSNQTNSAPDASSDVKPNAAAGHHHFLSASPDHFNATGQTTAFPTAASLDAKPMVKLSTVNFPTTVSVEADGKLSVDSACCWSEAKVQQLISFYSEHSCLWNHKSELYKNKLLRQSLLETLSSLLSDNETVPFSVEDVKTKFKNLRTVFQREHKSVNLNKTCGSEDFYLPKWKHYSDLLFLCDSCDEDEQPKDFQEPRESAVIHLHCQSPPSSLLCHGSTQTTTKLNRTSPSLKAPPSPTPPDSQPSSPPPSSPSTSSSCDDNRLLRLKRASPHLAPTSSEVLDFMRTFCQSQTASPHAGFLKYVEECLNEAPPDKVKKLKKKIIETIHSMSEEV